MTGPGAYVVEAEVLLPAGLDPAAVGAAVTVELCGHWEHEGACRWPHHSAIASEREPASFRTLFVADAAEAEVVGGRIEAVLRGAEAWRAVSVSTRPVADDEQELAERLLTGLSLPGAGREPGPGRFRHVWHEQVDPASTSACTRGRSTAGNPPRTRV